MNSQPELLQAVEVLIQSFVGSGSKQDFLDQMVDLVRRESGCEFVGIRILTDDGHIPYEAYVGFSREFWESENMIQVANEDCCCTRIVGDRLLPFDMPIINSAGSLHCNDTVLFAQTLSEAEQKQYRGACNKAGYRSVAVIPIRYRGAVIGVIHLADLVPQQLSPQIMEFVESVAPLIGEAISREKLEQTLKTSQDDRVVLESIVAGISSLAYVVDVDTFELIYTSRTLDELYGRKLVGGRCFEMFGFSAPCPGCPKPGGRSGGGIDAWERHDGVHGRDYLAEAKAVDWPDGRRVKLAFVTDVTRERKAEQALRDANADLARTVGELAATNAELSATNRELQDFANIVAHDFRTPMVNLQGFSRELGDSLADLRQMLHDLKPEFSADVAKRVDELLEKDVTEALRFIHISVARLDQMVAMLLRLAEAGRRVMNLQDVDMNELVAAIVRSYQPQIADKNIEITVGALPAIQTDRLAVAQIVGSLLDNAIKYLQAGRPGKIAISCVVGGGEYRFEVQDNGRGVAAGDLEKIFDIFRRAGKQDIPGDGMGLAFVRTLVRQLGGKVWCESAPGAGTKMTVALPK